MYVHVCHMYIHVHVQSSLNNTTHVSLLPLPVKFQRTICRFCMFCVHIQYVDRTDVHAPIAFNTAQREHM